MEKLNLIGKNADSSRNLLPYEGEVYYHGIITSPAVADKYYDILLNSIEWRNDEAFIFGKHYITKRKVAWYADKPFEYEYSNKLKIALPWTSELKEIKSLTEKLTKTTYNSCLLNLYHNGSEGMAWHSDDEKDLKPNGSIASLTFGAERKFSFKHKESNETVSLLLEHGSLLEMTGTCQTNWRHRLPPTKKIHSPRVNLTFRTMLE